MSNIVGLECEGQERLVVVDEWKGKDTIQGGLLAVARGERPRCGYGLSPALFRLPHIS